MICDVWHLLTYIESCIWSFEVVELTLAYRVLLILSRAVAEHMHCN